MLYALLVLLILLLIIKIVLLRKSADELRVQVEARLHQDTNVGLDVSTSDRTMRELTRTLDEAVRALRERELRTAQGDRELHEAVTNISHDLRTPLTAACGYVELLEGMTLPEKAEEYLAIVRDRLDALSRLAEEFFRYAVVLSQKEYAERESVDLRQAVEESLAANYALLKKTGIDPDVSLPELPVLRSLNRAAVARILGNLISNAVKYSPGDLTIRLDSSGRLTVANAAPQLDDVAVARLFERYFSVETGRGNTGLGLSIARTLTEQMGGQLTASLADGVLTISLKFDAEKY